MIRLPRRQAGATRTNPDIDGNDGIDADRLAVPDATASPAKSGPSPPKARGRRRAAGPPPTPLKVSVGVARKRGLPGYGSIGASCGVELHLDPDLWVADPDLFRDRVRDAFNACALAVQDELDRRDPDRREPHPTPCCDGRGEPVPRPATPAQVRALRALAVRLDLDLDGLVRRRFEVNSPEGLSLPQASRLITELQPPAPDEAD